MDKIDRIINIVRNIKEEIGGMTTGSSGPVAGFSSSADSKGPVSGFDPILGKKQRKNGTIDFRRIPPPHKKWVKDINGKSNK